MRSFGGLIYVIGVLLKAHNIRKTVKSGTFVKEEVVEVTPTIEKKKKEKGEHWHRVIERKPVRLLVFSFIVIAIGGAVEIIPTMADRKSTRLNSSHVRISYAVFCLKKKKKKNK